MMNAHKDQNILKLFAEGRSKRYIMKECNVGMERINNVIFAVNNSCENKIGRPKKITQQLLEKIEEITILDASISDQSVVEELKKYNMNECRTTVNYCRHKLNFRYLKRKKIQNLNDIQVQKRLDFLNEIESGNIVNHNLLFSDESRFCIRSDQDYCWRKRGFYNKSTLSQSDKYNDSIMVWGCIGVGFKSPLIIFESTIDSRTYCTKVIESDFFSQADHLYGKYNWQLMLALGKYLYFFIFSRYFTVTF